MTMRSLLRHLLLGVVVALHLGVPPLVAGADARVARLAAEQALELHVEDLGRRHPAPQHTDTCVLCQFVGLAQHPGTSSAPLLLSITRQHAPTGTLRRAIAQASATPPPSRAPPTRS
jgi:hypothetical protein